MLTLLHSRRRKLGVLTLVVACAFMALWLRSLQICEEIHCLYAPRSLAYLGAGDGYLAVGHTVANDPDYLPTQAEWQSLPKGNLELGLRNYRWLGPFTAFGIGSLDGAEDVPPEIDSNVIIAAPYWVIVIPLSLLAAWLLLGGLRGKSCGNSQIPTG